MPMLERGRAVQVEELQRQLEAARVEAEMAKVKMADRSRKDEGQAKVTINASCRQASCNLPTLSRLHT